LAAEERDVSGVALVTGGARGIGSEVVRQLAQQGMTAVLGARDPDKASAAAQKLTDAGLDVGARPIPDGVAGVLWATLPDDGTSSGFFRDGEPMPW
jgi:NAD(P)-dependent dehydrogenase (short-subunit alcohol dehydrogenase family)